MVGAGRGTGCKGDAGTGEVLQVGGEVMQNSRIGNTAGYKARGLGTGEHAGRESKAG